MKRFTFRLETTLRHRETIEGLRELDYFLAQNHLAAIERRLLALQESIRGLVTTRPGALLGERFDAPGLYDRERYVQSLQSACDGLERQAEAARIVAESARLQLVTARQNRAAVSHLKEDALSAHVTLQLKTEQDTLDEMATLRAVRRHPARTNDFPEEKAA